MGFRKQMQTVFIDAESGLDTTLPDGTQTFCKDTAKLWVLNNGAYTLISSGATTFNPEGWTVIVKSADQDVTTASFQNDSELNFSVDAGGMYMIECSFASMANTTTDSQARFAVDAGSFSGRGTSIISNVAGAIFLNGAANTNTLTITDSATSSLGFPESWKCFFAFHCSNSTTFRWTFGNSAATARMLKGSILKYKKLN